MDTGSKKYCIFAKQLFFVNMLNIIKKSSTFKCPRCGKEEIIKNSSVRMVITHVDGDIHYVGNRYKTQIRQKYYNVRFCLDCDKKIARERFFRHVLAAITPSVLLLFTGSHPLLCMVGGAMIYMALIPAIVEIYRNIRGKSKKTKELLQRAKDGNAIVR